MTVLQGVVLFGPIALAFPIGGAFAYLMNTTERHWYTRNEEEL